MLINAPDSATARWAPRLVTFAVWALALASVVYWGLLASSEPAAAPAGVLAEARTPIDTGAVAKSLGAMGAAPVAAVNPSTRFVLSGVIAGHSSSGAALISIDGKPPKPYRVGSVVDGDLLLQSVAPRRAELAARLDGPPAFALEMPVRK